MRTLFFLLVCCALFASVGKAQELLMKVDVISTQLTTNQATEKTIFVDMQRAIQSFVNNQRWTSDDFRKDEQIECFLSITLTEAPSQNYFKATAQLRAVRPVYNTSFKTPILSYIDRNFEFGYTQGQQLIYAKNIFTDDLSSMLAFYANVILAMDYDSFSKGGGAQYAEEAFNIVNIAQGSANAGWKRQGSTINRYWLAENLQSQQMIPFREAIYNYHLLGLDNFLKNPEKAREEILKVLEVIDGVNKLKPAAVYMNIFFDAKGLEIMNIFLPTPLEMRKKVHSFLTRLDPNKAPQYSKLIE